MAAKYRIPITAITVFGASSLLAVSIGIVLVLGFGQAAQTTRQLWADQANTLIEAMEQSLDSRLAPIRHQALYIARDIQDLSDTEALDEFIFGAMAATPQVAGVAVVSTNGYSRRWHRGQREAINQDWSQDPNIMSWLTKVEKTNSPAWRDPVFTDTVNTTTLLHDVPIRNAHGEFIGVFAQIVPVQELSAFLSKSYADTGITPFVLYNRNFVLAHPGLTVGSATQPLLHIEELGDLVLSHIWTPDEEATFIQPALKDIQASGLLWGDDYYLYLYRNVEHYGSAPWTIGAYVNTTLLSDDDIEQFNRALMVGLLVLVLAVAASVVVGRKVSSPVKAIVRATGAIDRGELEAIEPLDGSHIRELDDASGAFNKMVNGLRERALILDTLGRFLPEKVANSLLAGGGKIEAQQSEATVLFCDLEAFTQLTERLGPIKLVDVLNTYFSAMVDILEKYDGVVTQFQGDAILATFNVPVVNADHASNAIQAGKEMLRSVNDKIFDGETLNIRIGINTGIVVAGAIGARGRLNYTVHGDAVNLAARLESLNKEYGTRLLVSEQTAKLASNLELCPISETTVRGQTHEICLYTLTSIHHQNQ